MAGLVPAIHDFKGRPEGRPFFIQDSVWIDRVPKFTNFSHSFFSRKKTKNLTESKFKCAEAQAQRTLFSAVRLWRICPVKLCRRQKACRGEVARCLHERWRPVVPPEFKALLQKIFAAQRDGMTLPEAIAAAQANMAAHRRARESEAARAQSNSPFVPAKAETRFVAKELDARFRGQERKTEPAQFTIAEPSPPPVTRTSPRRRGPRVSQL